MLTLYKDFLPLYRVVTFTSYHVLFEYTIQQPENVLLSDPHHTQDITLILNVIDISNT